MARPALRLRLAPKFPSRLIGTTGISSTTSGGATTLAMDWSEFQEPVGAFDPGIYDILAYDEDSDEFNRVPLSTARIVNYREVTVAGAVTVTTSDGTIGINKTVPEATTVNLLAAASGFPLTIKDVAGNAGTYNITIDASGSETIDGASTFVIGSDYQSITLTPVSGGWITNAEYSGNTAVVPGTYPFASVTVDERGRITFIQSSAVPTAPAGVLSNAGLSASVGSSALTISLTDAAGLTPTLDSLVSIPFRSATAATGSFTQRLVGSATTLVISSGSTMGFTSATAGRLWIVAFDDAGTVRLAAINCRSGVNVFPLGQFGIASSTAEGGAGAADSAHVFYTGTAVTSKAYTVLGYLEWSAGLTTAGTWGIVPTRIDTFKPGMKLPGDVVQVYTGTSSTYSSNNANAIPNDNTIPQNTEGAEISVTPSITPASAANVLHVETTGTIGSSFAGTSTVGLSICRSDQADAIVAGGSFIYAANAMVIASLKSAQLIGTTSAFTVSNRYGPTALTYSATINGTTARLYGTAQTFWLFASEIVA
jgi:hypothetical protein